MITYIKKNTTKKYIQFEEELNPELFDNIGTTYDDYLNNKWVKLSDEQVAFHDEHPNASIKEVFEMKLKEVPTYTRTLEDAKRDKLEEIDSYDNSENVNSFTINNIIPAWFTPTERSNYANSINSAEILGVEELTFYIGTASMKVPTLSAKQMLAAIQLYADACYIVTKSHEAAVEALETIEEVDNYDYKVGYPEKLNFNLE